MHKRYFLVAVSALLCLSACRKYLDIKPKGSYIPVTVADYDNLLNNANTAQLNFTDMFSGSLLSYLSDNLVISEGQAKVGFVTNSNANIERYYAYIYRQPYKNPINPDFFWSQGLQGIYPQISYFNNVIQGIAGIADKNASDEVLAKMSVAQATVARAWCYMNANFVYGPVYKPGGGNTAKTIPFVTSADLNDPIPDLSTQDQMMTTVMNELYQSLPYLPEVASWPSRANKATGLAMLAYCHLFTQRYDSVAYYANLAWISGTGGNAAKVIYDYNLFTWSTPANLVTSLISTPQDAFLNAVNSREMLFYRGTDANAGQAALLSYPSDDLIAQYDAANDLRFKYFYINAPGYKTAQGGGYDDGMRISYYRAPKAKMTDGFTYPELLLMRAEGYARTNQLNLAIADLNTLRQYRFKTGTPPLTVGTQDEVIQEVLNERRRELPAGGLKRFLDLKRLVLETGKPWCKTKITHSVGAQSFSAMVNSDNFTLTISNTYLQFNPNWGIPLDTRPF